MLPITGVAPAGMASIRLLHFHGGSPSRQDHGPPGTAMDGRRRRGEEVGLLELPGWMRCPDIAFPQSRSSPALVCRVRFLGTSDGLAFDPSAEAMPVPFLDQEGTDRMVPLADIWDCHAEGCSPYRF